MLDEKKAAWDLIEVPAWTKLTDLASTTFGGQVLFATDGEIPLHACFVSWLFAQS